jgi:DNA-binding beta-propeller fold protein YncE
MGRSSSWPNPLIGIVVFGLLAGVAGLLVFSANRRSPFALERRASGEARLMSVQRLPETDGEVCQFVPASFPQSRQPSRAAVPSEAARAEAGKRLPIRTLRDNYAAYSAVAVDPTRNEVIMTDENLYQLLVYDRRSNTPPTATMSEPKRVIAGSSTELEYQCALYVDPANGDIYAVNNDTVDKLVIFSNQDRGNVHPNRFIETPHTTFGIAVDEKNQELMLTVQDGAAVVTYPKSAKNDDPPIRLLQGEKTRLADPHGITFDPTTDLLYVTNWGSVNVAQEGRDPDLSQTNWPVSGEHAVPGSGKFMPASITVYPRTAAGDAAPLRVIQGPKTQLNWPTALAIDHEHGELFVANDTADSILVFDTAANGDVAPIRVLKGSKTLIKNPTGVSYDAMNDELWVANFGNHTATVYKRTASGDTPPLRTIRSAPLNASSPMLGNPHTVAYDSKRDELLVSN